MSLYFVTHTHTHAHLDNAGERLSNRENIIGNILVLGLLAGVKLVVRRHRRRGGSIRPPPDEHLISSVLGDSL